MNPDDVVTTETAGLADSSSPSTIRLRNGDRFQLHIVPVRKRLDDIELRMLAYNGSIPGPTLHVDQQSEIIVGVTNDGDLDTTVHWHGLRLENRYDGVPNLVWKDTVLVRMGETVDILLDVTNPGMWMAHCHIAEHIESGMMLNFNVSPA